MQSLLPPLAGIAILLGALAPFVPPKRGASCAPVTRTIAAVHAHLLEVLLGTTSADGALSGSPYRDAQLTTSLDRADLVRVTK